jgi:hypothetical protein
MPYTNVYIFRTKGTKSFSIKVHYFTITLQSLSKIHDEIQKKINDKNQT